MTPVALKRIAALRAGDSIESDAIASEGEYPVFGGNGVRGYTTSWTHDGDRVLIGRQGALCGNVNLASGRFWASEHAIVVTPIGETNVRWLAAVLESMALGQYSQSAAQPGISVDVIGRLQVPLPPPAEQRAIADSLDRETPRIDALIAAKQQMIELLQERDVGLIHDITARGIQDAETTPSGVAWLGDVPRHWQVMQIRRIGYVRRGASPRPIDNPVYFDDDGDPESTKTVDLCLFVNGIPVATAELKNHLTGQNIEHAVEQYRRDRDPKNVTLGRRALVHFAVDPDAVAMTTRLAGKDTRFLPFNVGHNLGKGNPPNPNGHKTSYLWEKVWARDAWLDILHRFIHVERPEKGSIAQRRAAERVIFPRYHQWDAVMKLEADAYANGAGRSYLIQHSAGSGKSNTIAWTAHRLSTLHDAADRKVFDKVVVITDRVVLDRQLQETIYQFEHARGVVVKIDESSQQLADALTGEQARIIITTLQKFPFVLDKVAGLPARSYAVVIDEAHSSQGGESAKDLRVALGAGSEHELTVAEAEDAGLLAVAIDPVEEALARQAGARSRNQSNLSFFAFTATPKGRTLEMFGALNPASGKHEPFHLYSMRQAIEEGFILDVLANYTTYHTFWKIEKATTEDPEYDPKKARRAIARFVSLHPHQLAQKAEIIVEHFRAHTSREMQGQAKAMVVTSSRLHAARYKQAIDKYAADHGYEDVRTLVAFSGKLDDGTGSPLTEAAMNGAPESRTAEVFAGPEYGLLIVAEKFQTGFDQPLLQTMYVDKTLVGLAAVQTLSRLNRIHPLKERTFVLDFRNRTEDIVEAFEEFHGCTVAPPTDPNILWDSRRLLDDHDVLRPEEITRAMPALLGAGGKPDERSAATYAALAPSQARFYALGDEDQAEFRDSLTRFVRTYSFVSQISPFTDPGLESDYVFCRALSLYLRNAGTVERLDLGTDVELTHLRHQMTYSGELALTSDVGEVQSFFGTGTGGQQQLELESLSSIVEQLNDRFGTDFSEADQLLFDQFHADWVADGELSDQAQSNTIDNFRLAFQKKFMNTIVTRMDTNSEIFKRILDEDDLQEVVRDYYLKKVYAELRDVA